MESLQGEIRHLESRLGVLLDRTVGHKRSEHANQKVIGLVTVESVFEVENNDSSVGDQGKPCVSEADRSTWSKQIEFALSCIGYSVGLGNIWRFPYLCMKYGGGAFLVPYFLYLVACGMSLFFMETAIGQSTGLSTIRIFNMIPIFQGTFLEYHEDVQTIFITHLSSLPGLGWAMVFASGILSIYYNIIIAWVLYFMGMSFQWDLPWASCNKSWNTPQCFTYADYLNLSAESGNISFGVNRTAGILRSAAEEFWLYNVLEISENIDVIGGVNWKLLIALTAAWVLTFVCMCKGIRSSGKVVYLTAILPYVFLTVILIRGCTLPGAWEGLKLYILPDWSRLADIEVWIAAATQIFYSLGPAWGGLITFASYNKYQHNVLRDSVLLPAICGFTSFYGGFAIFSVIGHLMYITGQNDHARLVRQGPGLAFVAYPQALSMLPGSAIWSVLFFLMLLSLGLDSQFATLEAVTTGLNDQFPKLFRRRHVWLTLAVCSVEYLLGLILSTNAGFYYFELFDNYATAFSVVLIGFIETIVIAYFYGARRLLNDVEGMLGPMHRITRIWWCLAWCLLVPLMILVIIISTFVTHVNQAKERLKQFPLWAIAVGWVIACLSFVQIPIMAGVAVIKHGFDWSKLFLPNTEWGIVVQKRHEEYVQNHR
ncbi:sodium-dependent proline transporter [Fasciola gigantica]|uniref:Transporter n=1 Tax=Fasciola gigantica TaxID=46835 RepID=A0A504YH74_FASGI|nr:sodium-dependent proline transporter [Fasciola gigantica]